MAAGLILAGGAAVAVADAAQERMTFSGYLPPLKGHDWSQGPSYILCPEPWVEIVEDGTGDGFYDEVWNCAPTDYTCFHTAERDGGYGCSGGNFPGWEVSEAALVADFRDEIMEHVVMPCLMDSARRQDLVEGISPVDVALAVNPQMGEGMIDALTPPLSAGLDWAARKVFYDLSRQTCVNAARAAE